MTATALPPPAGQLWRAQGFYALLAVYYLVHVLLRPWLTATAGSDDVDQLLFSQALAPGYDVAQQPLYTWLVWAAVKLIGPTVAAAAFVKYTLLLLIHATMYGIAGRFVTDERVRFVAGFSPLLIYPMAWRIHEADTHGLLATLLMLVILWQALKMSETRRAVDYLVLGLLAGLALLTSLYLIIALIALAAALRLDPRHAPMIGDTKLAISIGAAAVVFFPYGFWLAGHWFEALATLDVELRAGLALSFGSRILVGTGALIAALALSVFPLWLFVPLIVPGTLKRLGADLDERLILTYCAAAVGLLLLYLVTLGIAEFSHYRLYPVFWPLSLYLFRRIDRAGFEPRRARFMAALLLAVFVMVVQLRIQQIFVGPAYCKTCRLQAPYPAAARALVAQGFKGTGTILADDEYLAGNMRVQFPQARVLSARYPLFRPSPRDEAGQCLLIWHAETGAKLPLRLSGLARRATGMTVDEAVAPRTVEAVVPHSDTALARRRTITLAFQLPDRDLGDLSVKRFSRGPILAVAVAGLSVAIALSVWIGSIRGPAGPAMGMGVTDLGLRPVDPGKTMVFANFNIRTGRGQDDQRDLARTAECLKGLTVIGLNEVRGSAWIGRAHDQAETLGKMLGMGYLFAPTERRFGREHFGNALLTTIPASEWLRIQLPRHLGDSHRNMLLAELMLTTGRLTVLVTHVDAVADRDLQLAAVIALFRTLREPAVLIGDLNAGPEHPDIARLLATPGVIGSNGAMPPGELAGRVEWVVVKGLTPVAASRCDVGASDHPRVALEVATPR